MKVDLDLQTICTTREYIRGVPYYTIELTKALLDRGNNNYTASFCDYKGERKNREHIEDYLGKYVDRFESIYECNDLNYLTVLRAMENGDPSSYDHKTYDEWMGTDADVYHFFHLTKMPQNVDRGRVVVTIHDIMPYMPDTRSFFPENVVSQFENQIKYLKGRKDINIITISENSKNDLVKYADIDADRVFVTPLAYNQELYFKDTDSDLIKKWDLPEKYILYLSALDPRKGIDTLIKAEPMLEDKKVPIVLAGGKADGYDIASDMAKASNSSRFIQTGYVSDDEKRQLMSNASMYVFPSRYEGFGLPVLEAMACGTPVITTNTSSIPEVGGDAVIYIEPGNAEQLATEINRLLSDEALRDEYVTRGSELVKDFSWDRTAKLTEEVYNSEIF